MEQFILFLEKNVPEIVVTIVSVLCYILYFIITMNVKKNKKGIHTLVKEKVNYIDSENSNLSKVVNHCKEELENNYRVLQEKVSTLEKKVTLQEEIIKILIDGEGE